MKKMVWGTLILSTCFWCADSEARREIKTARQKARLEKAERVLVDVLALTDKGEVKADAISEIIIGRIQELGYTVVTDPGADYDVIFRVKCEQRKQWEGTGTSGGDADLPDSPSRVWKGPACQLTYLLSGKKLGWHKEVRTEFQDAVKAATEAQADDPGAYALRQLQEKLKGYDFPVLVTADWGQTSRLLALLEKANTPEQRKLKIISVLGDMFAEQAMPALSTYAKGENEVLAEGALLALGKMGKLETIPLLTERLKAGKPRIQAAAAKALGDVGSLNFESSVVDPLLVALETDHVEVKTEVAWALGKLSDRKALAPLRRLYDQLHSGQGSKVPKELVELRKAVFWSLRQISPVDHIGLE